METTNWDRACLNSFFYSGRCEKFVLEKIIFLWLTDTHSPNKDISDYKNISTLLWQISKKVLLFLFVKICFWFIFGKSWPERIISIMCG